MSRGAPRRGKRGAGATPAATAGAALLAALALGGGCASSGREGAGSHHIGARAGYFAPVLAKKEEFQASAAFGAYYRAEPLTATTLMYEVAVDFTAPRSKSGAVESSLWTAALDLLWCPWSYWSGAGWSPDFYLFGGGGVLSEASLTEMSAGRLKDIDWTGAVNLGLGLASLQKGWNLRATYALFPGSRNVKSAVSITAGWALSF